MEIKFGKVKPTSSNSLNFPSLQNRIDENFFNAENVENENPKQKQEAPGLRLNDYDSNILEKSAYQDLPDEMFKIEHRIDILEKTLLKINNEIEALKSLGADIQISELQERKQKIEQEIIKLSQEYSNLGISAKISGQIASAVTFTSNKKMNPFSNFSTFFSKKVLAKISKKFGYSQSIKESLTKLSDINTGVDELINLQTPYGENVSRYEKLTAYLNKANVLQSQISKNINQMTKKNELK